MLDGSPNNSDIRLIVFDLGGVMIRICDDWRHALACAGIDPLPDAQTFNEDTVPHDVYLRFEMGKISEGEFAAQVAAHTALTAADTLAVVDAWLIEPNPGFHELLDRLEGVPVQTACLSNTNRRHWQTMTTPGPRQLPLDRLHHRFGSPFIGQRKPDPAVYEHVQQQVGVAGSAILFFDDHGANLAAAAQQGWHTHRVDPNANPAGQVTRHLTALGIICDR